MARSSKDAARILFSRALEQGGYFTAKQAREAGYDYPHLDYHVASGNFERVDHGLLQPVGDMASHLASSVLRIPRSESNRRM